MSTPTVVPASSEASLAPGVAASEVATPGAADAIATDGIFLHENPAIFTAWFFALVMVTAGLLLHVPTLALGGQGLYVITSARTFRSPADRLSLALVSLIIVAGAFGFGRTASVALILYIAQNGLARVHKTSPAIARWLH